jgi:hypothetical protein
MALVLGFLPAGLLAQSLGDVAAKEQKKKDGQKSRPARVYTDEDLKRARESGGSAVTVLGPPPGEASTEGTSASSAPQGKTELEQQEEAGAKREEWRSRAQTARAGVSGTEERIARLLARIEVLTNDLDPNPDDIMDPNRLGKREVERQQALKDLAQAQDELVAAKKALEDLETAARRNNIPRVWLEP